MTMNKFPWHSKLKWRICLQVNHTRINDFIMILYAHCTHQYANIYSRITMRDQADAFSPEKI